MTAPRVLILGGIGTDPLDAAHDLGAEPLLLQNPGRLTDAQRARAVVAEEVDMSDEQAAVDACLRLHAAHPCDAIVPMTEFGLVPAARVTATLGLPGASDERTARLLRDKAAMRRFLVGTAVPAVAARVVGPGEPAPDLSAADLPVVVKPRGGVGSASVHRVDDLADLPAAVADVLAASPAGAVIEEFLDGPEFSVETFGFDGDHLVAAVTGKQVMANFVEIGHVVPAPLAPADADAIGAAVRTFLDVVGVRNGPAHTEVILTPKGPRIVESHDRLGGDRIFRLVELATGIDLMRLSVGWPLGLCGQPGPERNGRAAAVRFLTAEPGVVTGVEQPASGDEVSEVVIQYAIGDTVPPVKDSWGRPGHVITVADSPAAALASAAAAADAIRIVTR